MFCTLADRNENLCATVQAHFQISNLRSDAMEKSKDGRQTISRKVKLQISAIPSIALLILLAVVPINAQVECLGRCEEKLAQCIQNQGNGLNFSASCIDSY